MRLRPLLFACFLLPAALAQADERTGDIRILAAWARATPGPTAVVYLDLKNEGLAADRLIDASTPFAQRIEFHEHRNAGGVMSMATGSRVCTAAPCLDGIANNCDGKTDSPRDPGCDSPSDNSETTVCPGAACPACAGAGVRTLDCPPHPSL
jgi:hypothetical protein